ncbi:MAG: hypothetical protein R8M45_10090 [Ghiorsea sp.]
MTVKSEVAKKAIGDVVRIRGRKSTCLIEGVNDKRFIDGEMIAVRRVSVCDAEKRVWTTEVKLEDLELV